MLDYFSITHRSQPYLSLNETLEFPSPQADAEAKENMKIPIKPKQSVLKQDEIHLVNKHGKLNRH